MLKRTITGFFILVVVGLAVASKLLTPWVFNIFALIVILGAINEMHQAAIVHNQFPYKILNYVFAVALVASYFAPSVMFTFFIQILASLAMFLVCILLEVLQAQNLHKQIENNQLPESEAQAKVGNRTFITFAIAVYPTWLLSTLVGINHFADIYLGIIALIVAFAVTMFSDVFAYLLGVSLKTRKIYPLISPKKSLAGLIGGTLGGIVAAGASLGMFYFAGWLPSCILNLSLGQAIALFAVIGVVGTFLAQFGDLLSSIVKRRVGIKDFGKIFPGHGGFMDRVDGLMFVTTFVYICFLFII